jgi:phosphatidylinositol alpha-1,6-mannosyltransferase
MHILFVSHSLPPVDRPLSNVGGMQRVAAKLHDELAAHSNVTLTPVLLRSPWRWVHLRVVPFLARAAWHIRRAVARGDVDVVLFSSMVTATLALPLRGLFDRHGVTAAAIVHGLDVTTSFPPYQWLVPKVFGALDAVLPVSRATAAACEARGLAHSKVHVVPNGIDLERFPPLLDRATMRGELREALATERHPLPDDALLLCSVGRQVERKGFAWFVEHVMPRLPSQVHYWLAGDGPRADAIQAAIDRHHVGDRVRLLGRVSEADLVRLYRGADLFIMPNVPVEGDMEGFGIVMLEAGQCGCPVVASRLEGIQDVVTNGVNGQLVEPEDPEAFAEAIRVYCDHPERLQPDAERAATHVAHAFGWRAVADQYVETLAACRPGGATANLAAANS